MPKALGIETTCKKGEFPYLLSSPSNYGKVWDSLPPLSYYSVDNMTPSRRETVKRWHSENRNKEFDFDEELKSYCLDDVKVLKLCVLEFRKIFIEITKHPQKAIKGICPFYKSFTLAGACNRVFRQLFLKRNYLALLHIEQQDLKLQNHSIASSQWLKYLNVSQNLHPQIRHARNGGEITILGLPVDGYRETSPNDRVVYRFLGCWFHGHISHISPDMIHPLSKVKMHSLYSKTVERTKKLKENGYSVIE